MSIGATSESEKTVRGTCLCGRVEFEIAGGMTQAGHCHCSMCRKASGSAFLSYVGVPPDQVRWTKGEENIGRYRSSPGYHRLFCTGCGSSLAAWPTDPQAKLTWMMMGVLDDDPPVRPEVHIFIGSKAPWYDLDNRLLCYESFPPKS